MIRSGEGFGSKAAVDVDVNQRRGERSSVLRSGFDLPDKAIEGLTADAGPSHVLRWDNADLAVTIYGV